MLEVMVSCPGNDVLISSLIIAFLFIAYARLVKKIPFTSSAPRSYALVNRREFVWLYPGGEGDLPSKLPSVEPLTGKYESRVSLPLWNDEYLFEIGRRLTSAYIIEFCFLAIVVLSAFRIHIDAGGDSNQGSSERMTRGDLLIIMKQSSWLSPVSYWYYGRSDFYLLLTGYI